VALGGGRTRRTQLLVLDILVIAGGANLHAARTVTGLERAAAKAVAAVGCTLHAKVDARLGHRAAFVVLGQVPGQAVGVVATSVVTGARIAVEEAVLPLRIHVVARDAGRERALVIVSRAGALLVEAVHLAVPIIVHAVRAGAGSAAQLHRIEHGAARRSAGPGRVCRAIPCAR